MALGKVSNWRTFWIQSLSITSQSSLMLEYHISWRNKCMTCVRMSSTLRFFRTFRCDYQQEPTSDARPGSIRTKPFKYCELDWKSLKTRFMSFWFWTCNQIFRNQLVDTWSTFSILPSLWYYGLFVSHLSAHFGSMGYSPQVYPLHCQLCKQLSAIGLPKLKSVKHIGPSGQPQLQPFRSRWNNME